MGISFNIGGYEIRSDSPEQFVREGYEHAKMTITTLAEAATSGNPEKFKELAGELVLNNNLTTIGAKQVAEDIFPHIPAESFERIVGTGVISYITSGGDPILVVIAVANQFYGEYQLSLEPPDSPFAGDPIIVADRLPKTFSLRCEKLQKIKFRNGTDGLLAGFVDLPVFVDEEGVQFTWPTVDFRSGDLVHLSALHNDLPEKGTISSGTGRFKFQGQDTPGLGARQINKIFYFEPIS